MPPLGLWTFHTSWSRSMWCPLTTNEPLPVPVTRARWNLPCTDSGLALTWIEKTNGPATSVLAAAGSASTKAAPERASALFMLGLSREGRDGCGTTVQELPHLERDADRSVHGLLGRRH